MPLTGEIQPTGLNGTKNVFLSAIRFATLIDVTCPPFGDELKTSAQEQIEFMIMDDGEEMLLVASDEEVLLETRVGMLNIYSSFERELASLLLHDDEVYVSGELSDDKIMACVYDIEWMCEILQKMNLMKDFVVEWIDISSKVLDIVEDKKLAYVMWGLKSKLIVVTTKVLEAVGYGNVIVPAHNRLQLLKVWLPFIRKMKPLLDSFGGEDENARFLIKMDEDLCQSIEGATTSLILALPSNDQAELFMNWMNTRQYDTYPDLTEAFEMWCYRTKSAKRRFDASADDQCITASTAGI
ncbi:hypothetical protein Leryth_016753 [Lithospermum erythrorhizon]|nr:hypothetical protein Leryth_016753 [Lithospermum erythrorhizon]